ncbi:MAG: sugar phosphate isomerase/epimerase [Rikenellaceae bacterium]|nr:sugar phosphate isomerase/epimerase [Rikenellaceae bacterium]
MNRRDFIVRSAAGLAVAAAGPIALSCGAKAQKSETTMKPELKISFQEGIPPGETLSEKFDYMERHGVTGFEPWGGGLADRVPEIKSALEGRNIEVSAICAGFDGFILAEEPQVKAAFDRTMREIIAAAGQLGSTGVIMVPAFNGQTPCKPHTQATRDNLVEELAKLGDFAVENGTTVILEPLMRGEAFYLRQVADAASICRDAANIGVKCMGDFWHMTWEETSDYGAFFSAGEHLQHVHIASRANRIMPGEDGPSDNYTDGFRALQELGYDKWVSFECGTRGEREETVTAALELIRRQWEEA